MFNELIRNIFRPTFSSMFGDDEPSPSFSLDNQGGLTAYGRGDVTPTFTRATSATTIDHEGLIKPVGAGEYREVGSRRVENLLTASEDMTNGAYSVINNAVVDSATQVTYDGTADGYVRQVTTITDDGSGSGGRTFVFSVWVKLVSGTISSDAALQLLFEGNAVNVAALSIGDEVTTTAQRFSVTTTTDAAGTQVSPEVRWDDAGVLEITKWQLEEVTGQLNQNPSEYVSSGVLSAPYHGANVDSVKLFTYENGNTVASGLVTQAQGDPIAASTLLGYWPETARTNICLRYRNFEHADWVAANVTKADNAAVGPYGTTTASSLTATAANGTVIQDLGVIGSAIKSGGLWIKRLTGSGDIDLTLDGGSTWTTVTVTAGWTRVQVSQTLANPDFGIRIVTDTDAVYVEGGQVEAASFLSSDIPTTAPAVARNKDELTYPSASNATFPMTVLLDYTPVQVDELDGAVLYLDDGTSDERTRLVTLASHGKQTWFSTAGGSLDVGITATSALTPGTTYTFAGVAATNNFELFQDGVTTGTPDTSAATPTITTIRVGMALSSNVGQPHGYIRNIRIYNKVLSATQIARLSA